MSTVTPIRELTQVSFTTESSKAFIAGALAAIAAASKDDARPILTEILVRMDHENGKLQLISTNSYRGVRVTLHSVEWQHTGESTEPVQFMVAATALKDALPKPSDFKASGNDYLSITYYPGKAALDAGELGLVWGSSQRIIRATPNDVGNAAGQYPNIENLIDGAIAAQKQGATNEQTCWSADYMKEIAAECKRINKARPVRFFPGPTPMKPGMFSTLNDGIKYECLLMPVREP